MRAIYCLAEWTPFLNQDNTPRSSWELVSMLRYPTPPAIETFFSAPWSLIPSVYENYLPSGLWRRVVCRTQAFLKNLLFQVQRNCACVMFRYTASSLHCYARENLTSSWDLEFSQQCWWRFHSSLTWRVHWCTVTKVYKEPAVSIISVLYQKTDTVSLKCHFLSLLICLLFGETVTGGRRDLYNKKASLLK